jgi:hypothetical protein
VQEDAAIYIIGAGIRAIKGEKQTVQKTSLTRYVKQVSAAICSPATRQFTNTNGLKRLFFFFPKVSRAWRMPLDDELPTLCSLRNILKVIKSWPC